MSLLGTYYLLLCLIPNREPEFEDLNLRARNSRGPKNITPPSGFIIIIIGIRGLHMSVIIIYYLLYIKIKFSNLPIFYNVDSSSINIFSQIWRYKKMKVEIPKRPPIHSFIFAGNIFVILIIFLKNINFLFYFLK